MKKNGPSERFYDWPKMIQVQTDFRVPVPLFRYSVIHTFIEWGKKKTEICRKNLWKLIQLIKKYFKIYTSDEKNPSEKKYSIDEKNIYENLY